MHPTGEDTLAAVALANEAYRDIHARCGPKHLQYLLRAWVVCDRVRRDGFSPSGRGGLTLTLRAGLTKRAAPGIDEAVGVIAIRRAYHEPKAGPQTGSLQESFNDLTARAALRVRQEQLKLVVCVGRDEVSRAHEVEGDRGQRSAL